MQEIKASLERDKPAKREKKMGRKKASGRFQEIYLFFSKF